MHRYQPVYVHSDDCKEACDYLEALHADPMTKHYGCAGEASALWLKNHIKTCEKCKKATIEENTP